MAARFIVLFFNWWHSLHPWKEKSVMNGSVCAFIINFKLLRLDPPKQRIINISVIYDPLL